MHTKVKALLATGRISNLPTVWCNCLAGALILINFTPSCHPWLKHMLADLTSSLVSHFTVFAILLITISSLIYVGGCFLGDYHDREFDAQHKPNRPIPSGVLKSSTVAIIGFVFMTAAYLGAVITPPMLVEHLLSSNMMFFPLLLLIFSVTWYGRFHKRSLFIGLPLIGMCRFSLVIMAAAAASISVGKTEGKGEYLRFVTEPYVILPIIIYASAVAIYTIAFASVARTESSDSPITWRNLLRYTMLALPLSLLFTNQSFQIETITALVIYAVWLLYAFTFLDTNKGNYVSKCLAGFCLLDACFVAQFGWSWLILCLILFIMALALQKIAPAT